MVNSMVSLPFSLNHTRLSPPHLKLGLVKNAVNSLDREERGSTLLQLTFPRISFEKLTTGIGDGPKILQQMKNSMLDDPLSVSELSAWRLL